MSNWGRNNQAVTANSTTTQETSNGAPMGTYALVSGSGKGVSPIPMTPNSKFGNTSPGSAASVDVSMFGNTTTGAFIDNLAVGVFGVSAVSMANNVAHSSKERPAHAGWVVRREGAGPVTGAVFTAGGSGYSNTDYVSVTQTNSSNAKLTFSTNSTGGITPSSVTLVTAGGPFTVTAANAEILAANGSPSVGTGAAYTVTYGGRAGRVQTETLVAMGTLGTGAGVTSLSTTQYP